VTVTAGGRPSNGITFFVQIPTKLVFANVPGAPNGVGPLFFPVNEVVRSLNGVILFNGVRVCGVYRHYAFYLMDQDQPAQRILQAFTIGETFSEYHGPGSTPTAFTAPIPANLHVPDIQILAFPHPRCLGPRDREDFLVGYFVRIGATDFPLTTKFFVNRGNIDGNLKVDAEIRVP
jgi:hypothetical protein